MHVSPQLVRCSLLVSWYLIYCIPPLLQRPVYGSPFPTLSFASHLQCQKQWESKDCKNWCHMRPWYHFQFLTQKWCHSTSNTLGSVLISVVFTIKIWESPRVSHDTVMSLDQKIGSDAMALCDSAPPFCSYCSVERQQEHKPQGWQVDYQSGQPGSPICEVAKAEKG